MGSGRGRLTIGDNTWQKRTPGQLQQQTQRTAGTGRKRVVRFATDQRQSSWDTRTDAQSNWPDNPVVLSSSTSIVRDGQCAQDALTTRWSAFGTDGKGRSVFISSTSQGRTHVDELCRVFLALGIPNAIRPDGGPSATMTIEGRLLNPLVSLSHLMAFGPARYVIDGVGARAMNAERGKER
ncbi:phosphodiester glycosidase family protein [Lautropia mirabilis]